MAVDFPSLRAIEEALGAEGQTAVSTPGAGDVPRTATEEMLVRLWKDLLRVSRVGIHDNFFEIGGHSLIGAVLLSRIQHEFEVDLPLHRLFSNPTVARLAELIEEELLSTLSQGELADLAREEDSGVGEELLASANREKSLAVAGSGDAG